MTSFPDLRQVQAALDTAQTIFVVLPTKISFDQTAAGLALFLSLKKAGKQVSIASSQPMTVTFSSLVGVDKIQQKLGGRNLVVSFDYLEDSIEKVSYNIESNQFNLVIQPKAGFTPLATDKIKYRYTGGQADLVVIVGAQSWLDLGEIYQKNKEFFEKTQTLDFSLQTKPKTFAKINFFNPTSAAFCETMANLLARLRLPVEADVATNLFAGLQKTTHRFASSKVGPATFEAAAFCLRAGARRAVAKKVVSEPSLEPMPTEVSAVRSPEPTPSPDWLEPKIYKGNTKI